MMTKTQTRAVRDADFERRWKGHYGKVERAARALHERGGDLVGAHFELIRDYGFDGDPLFVCESAASDYCGSFRRISRETGKPYGNTWIFPWTHVCRLVTVIESWQLDERGEVATRTIETPDRHHRATSVDNEAKEK